MRSWMLLPAALLLDAIVGDPPRRSHPTRLMGGLAARLEPFLRRRFPPLLGGALGWGLVVGTAVLAAWGLPRLAGLALTSLLALWGIQAERPGAIAEELVGLWFVATAIAPRDLARHAAAVGRALGDEGLAAGREAVSRIVGRDVERLDEAGVLRAAIESVAESSVDGVIAPLFWAFLLGPVGALGYRAINTLDSMWGYRDERYLRFGRIAARADDLANWLPARLGFLVAVLASSILGLFAPSAYSGREALRIGWRDRRKHESPNAAWLEASFAGALGLRLGGPAWYGGEILEKPYLGEGRDAPGRRDLSRAIVLMYGSTLVFLLLGIGCALLL